LINVKSIYSNSDQKIQVTVTPEDNKTIVFNNGTWNGFKHSIPNGGHTDPIWTAGAKLEWKNAQNQATKNMISETTNKIKPIFNPHWTLNVWWPWNVDSRNTSRHHTSMIKITWIKPEIIIKNPQLYPWKYIAEPVVNVKAPKPPNNGHGLWVTKWKKCFWRGV
jgi:hypothetical protein